MAELVQGLANGLLIGGIYATLALGLTLIFGVMRVINFAHGEFMMLGGLVAYSLHDAFGISPVVALAVTIPLGALMGAAAQSTLMRPVMGRPRTAALLVTFGLSLTLVGVAQALWGNLFRSVRYLPGSWQLAGVTLPRIRVVAFCLAVAVSAALYVFLRRSKYGKAIRATSQHAEVAQTCGIDVSRVRTVTFGIGGALATTAGTLLVSIGVVYPQVGAAYLLKAFAVVIIGGLGSFAGAILGGAFLGIVESLGTQYATSSLAQAGAFLVLIATLLFRPNGLLGRGDGVRL